MSEIIQGKRVFTDRVALRTSSNEVSLPISMLVFWPHSTTHPSRHPSTSKWLLSAGPIFSGYTVNCTDQTRASLNPHLLALALTSTQSLISALFNLPVHPSDNGPTAKLPNPVTQLPREKPLPKAKPPTKWERFAKEKGISHSKKERDVWDDDKQEWVRRWGKGGKNKEQEGAWLTEVKTRDGKLTLLTCPNAKLTCR